MKKKNKLNIFYYAFIFGLLVATIVPSEYISLNQSIHVQPPKISPPSALQSPYFPMAIIKPSQKPTLSCNSVLVYSNHPTQLNLDPSHTFAKAYQEGVNGFRAHLSYEGHWLAAFNTPLVDVLLATNNITLLIDSPTNTEVAVLLETLGNKTPIIESSNYDILARLSSLNYQGNLSFLITSVALNNPKTIKNTILKLLTLHPHNLHVTVPITSLLTHKKLLAHLSSLNINISILEDKVLPVTEQHFILNSAISTHLWLPYALYVSKRYQNYCTAYSDPHLGVHDEK